MCTERPVRYGIMQPYFFPYAGYFDLIRKTDVWIVFDVVEYRPKTYMNRNQILNPNGEGQFISAPVDKRSGKLIADVRVMDTARVGDKLLRQLEIYRGKAPHYEAVRACVEGAFERLDSPLLCDLNVVTLDAVCRYLGIAFTPKRCSSLGLDFTNVDHAGAWALEICRQLGAREYLNPPGGTSIFRPGDWQAAGIGLAFTTVADFNYPVHRSFQFLPRASILDVMMWNAPDAIVAYLDTLPTEPHPLEARPA